MVKTRQKKNKPKILIELNWIGLTKISKTIVNIAKNMHFYDYYRFCDFYWNKI